MNAPLECIIQKYEKSTVDWKKGMSGKRSVIFREQDFKETGKRDFMNQLMELEMEGLVKVKWLSLIHIYHFYHTPIVLEIEIPHHYQSRLQGTVPEKP